MIRFIKQQKKNYQITIGLCYVYKKSLIDNFENDICKFLYFWLGNILLANLNPKLVYQDVLFNLFNILKNHKDKICTAPHDYMDEHDFKNIKLFFDYSEDYYSYIGQLNIHNPPCSKEYKKYLQTYVDTYNKFQRECQNEPPSYRYCNVFNKYFANKNRTHLSIWTCTVQDNEPEEANSETGEMDEYNETKATEEKTSTTYGMEGKSANFRGVFEQGRTQSTESLSSSGYYPHADTFVIDNVSGLSDDTPPSIISKSVTGAVSVAGALVPSYLLYNVISIMINKYNALFNIS
ncbi:hypothetical protein PVIIG_06375 [Plasmodium vivax India VII]|uniref:Variable surface protein Vir7-like protein n=1 Tax=Plasmodium vivax India VII TaxID=1077284 RepID=A0A0J9S4C3_PLAVI|nr:hypothetical protein PVIIG_06375 [Plasmodium vivax India VII]